MISKIDSYLSTASVTSASSTASVSKNLKSLTESATALSASLKTPSYDTLELSDDYSEQVNSALRESLAENQSIVNDKIKSMIREQIAMSYNMASGSSNSILNTNRTASNSADNIMNFVKAISGDTPSYITMLKNVVDNAFDSVSSVFGGSLPDITEKTYAEISKRFEEWESQLANIAENLGDSIE